MLDSVDLFRNPFEYLICAIEVSEEDAFQCEAGSCLSDPGHAKGQHHPAIEVTLGKSSRPCEETRWYPQIVCRLSEAQCYSKTRHLFSLPRIDDLLDLLGGAKYFDLAAGFWQILDLDLAKGSVRGTGPSCMTDSCMTDSCMTDSCMTWRPSLTINNHPVAKQLGSIMEIGLIFMQELP